MNPYFSQPTFPIQFYSPSSTFFNSTLLYSQNPLIQQSQLIFSNDNHCMVSIHDQLNNPQIIQSVPLPQQNLSYFQQFSPCLIGFDQNLQGQSTIVPNNLSLVKQSPFQPNQYQLQNQFMQQFMESQQFLQQQEQQQQYQILMQKQQNQLDNLNLQKNQQSQQLLTERSQHNPAENLLSGQQPIRQQYHEPQGQIFISLKKQQQSHQDSNEDIIVSKERILQSQTLFDSHQLYKISCSQITNGSQKAKKKQSADLEKQNKEERVRTFNQCTQKIYNTRSENNKFDNFVDFTKSQPTQSQQKTNNSQNLVSQQKHQNIYQQQEKKNKKLTDVIEQSPIQQEEIIKKIQLFEQLHPEIREIVRASIQINRQSINKALINGFKKYVYKNVKYVLNYEKLSATQYHFKSCQHLPVLINRDPSNKERDMFRKKFNKFIKSKQYSKNNDLKQIMENRLYCILFKEFLESEMAELKCLQGEENCTTYPAVIQFYLLCLKETQYLVFMNDSVWLNKKNSGYASALSNRNHINLNSYQRCSFSSSNTATPSVSQIVSGSSLQIINKEQNICDNKSTQISPSPSLPTRTTFEEKVILLPSMNSDILKQGQIDLRIQNAI